MPEPRILTAALRYAQNGWPVLPLRGKVPLTGHGYKDATLHADQIRSWWREWPWANVGIAVGRASNLSVLDMDPRAGGDIALDQILALHGPLPETYTVETGGGGRHWYFLWHESAARVELGPGLELKGHGGYVVAPPSVHPDSGVAYSWLQVDGATLAPIPEWLLTLASSPNPLLDTGELPPSLETGMRNRSLASLAGSMRRRGASEAVMLVALKAMNLERCSPPLSDSELEAIAQSIGRYAPVDPRVEAPEEDFEPTDNWNAKLFVKQNADKVRYAGRWLVWNGDTWEFCDERDVVEIARGTASSLNSLIIDGPTAKAMSVRQRHAHASGQLHRIRSMVQLAAATEGVKTSPTAIDSHPHLAACPNTIIDMKRGETMPLDPGLMMVRKTAVPLDLGARSATWDTFLQTILPDPHERAFVQAAVGYSLTAETSENCVFFIWGPTACGKSTFIDAVTRAIGTYCVKAEFDTFLKRKFDGGIRSDLARLAGARMIVCDEVGEDRVLSTEIIKKIGSGEEMTARFLYGELFTFRPVGKVWLIGNHQPKVSASDDAVWRRMRVVPFTAQIPVEKRDPAIRKVLTEDPEIQKAILAWIAKGAYGWYCMKKLPNNARVNEATQGYRDDQDTLKRFLEDKCIIGGDLKEESVRLYNAYREWAVGQGEQRVWTQQRLGRELRSRGYEPIRKNIVRYWQGLKLTALLPEPDKVSSYY